MLIIGLTLVVLSFIGAWIIGCAGSAAICTGESAIDQAVTDVLKDTWFVAVINKQPSTAGKSHS